MKINRRSLFAGIAGGIAAAIPAKIFAHLDEPQLESVPNAVAVSVDPAYDALIYDLRFGEPPITFQVPQAEWGEITSWSLAQPSTSFGAPLSDMKSLPVPIHTLSPVSSTEVWEEVDDDFLSLVNWPESSYISMEEDLALDGVWTEWVMLDGDIAKVFTPFSLNEPSYRVYTIPGANSFSIGTLVMNVE